MDEKEFIRSQINIVASLLCRDTNYKDIEEKFISLIQFGRDNPETCEIERNESNMQMCRECGHFIGQPQWDLKENGIYFCNGCGRKIKHEK